MMKFRVITKKIKPKQLNLLTGNKIKATRKSGQVNLLTGKAIKKKPKKAVQPTYEVATTNNIPSKSISIINTYPKDLQQFLTNTNILSVKTTAGMTIFKLENSFEVIVRDTTINNRPKKLIIIKQGKKQILKHTI